MPSMDGGRPEPKLDGTNGGDGLKGVTGDEGKLPVGEGGTRDDVGDCAGREGRDGPAESGELWRSDGDGECNEGDPDEIVDDLNALTVVIGRRIGTPVAEAASCKPCKRWCQCMRPRGMMKITYRAPPL